MAPSHRAVADESCVTVCQELRPHCGHLRYLRGWPDAFQRMPPPSQTDFANPHWQRTIQERELASIDSARRRGITAFRMCWIKLIAVAPFLMCRYPLKPSIAERPALQPRHKARRAKPIGCMRWLGAIWKKRCYCAITRVSPIHHGSSRNRAKSLTSALGQLFLHGEREQLCAVRRGVTKSNDYL